MGGEVIVGGADGGGSGKAREAHSDVSIARPALKLPVLPAAARHASTSGLLVLLERASTKFGAGWRVNNHGAGGPAGLLVTRDVMYRSLVCLLRAALVVMSG